MAFTINSNLAFIDRMQFMNSSLNKLVKKLIDNDFRYLSGEFSDSLLELVKQKGMYPYEYMGSFEKFSVHCLIDLIFLVLQKKQKKKKSEKKIFTSCRCFECI